MTRQVKILCVCMDTPNEIFVGPVQGYVNDYTVRVMFETIRPVSSDDVTVTNADAHTLTYYNTWGTHMYYLDVKLGEKVCGCACWTRRC